MDKHIICKECGKKFTFTDGDQQYYKDKFLDPPLRCAECRRIRKESAEARKRRALSNDR